MGSPALEVFKMEVARAGARCQGESRMEAVNSAPLKKLLHDRPLATARRTLLMSFVGGEERWITV